MQVYNYVYFTKQTSKNLAPNFKASIFKKEL
jgi:hypothetical protein